jgi:hypothetical protein
MSMLSARYRNAALLTLFALGLTACGRDGTGPGRGLAPEVVGGDYRICELQFIPAGSVPAPANILAALDTVSLIPRLEIGRTDLRQFSLLFRRPGGGTTQSIPGAYTTGAQSVQLNLGGIAAARQLLLPESITLDFDDAARSLTVSAAQPQYSVARTDYEMLVGRQEPNINPNILGRLSARFVAMNRTCN